MIWHIFKKDVRLLWPLALTLAIAQAVGAALVIFLGHFREPRELAAVANFYPYLVFLGIVILTIAAVHQEPLSGVRQDWLVRPIRPRDLLLAKMVFALMMIHVPILLIDVLEQAALGFPLRASIAAAAVRGFDLLCILTLPALLLGAVTASLVEALFFGLIVSVSCAILYLAVFVFVLKPSGLPSGVFWAGPAIGETIIVAGAALTLAFVYSRRRLLTARVAGVLVMLVALGVSAWLPFKVAFAIQQWVSGRSETPTAIEIRFDSAQNPVSGAGRNSVVFDGAQFRAATNMGAAPPGSNHSAVLVHLPVQISGLPRDGILFANEVAVRLAGPGGSTLYQGVGVCERLDNGSGRICRSNSLEVRESGAGASSMAMEQELNIPRAVYAKIKDQAVRLELNYALTLLRKAPAETMGTIGDVRRLPSLGVCATRIDSEDDDVELRCLSDTVTPSCATVVLEDPKTGRRNPELHACMPNYVPYPQPNRIEEVVNPLRLSLAFRDSSGLAQYPVDQTRVRSAQLSLITYHATDHFRRTLAIPSIRLVDWEDTQSPRRLSIPGS